MPRRTFEHHHRRTSEYGKTGLKQCFNHGLKPDGRSIRRRRDRRDEHCFPYHELPVLCRTRHRTGLPAGFRLQLRGKKIPPSERGILLYFKVWNRYALYFCPFRLCFRDTAHPYFQGRCRSACDRCTCAPHAVRDSAPRSDLRLRKYAVSEYR